MADSRTLLASWYGGRHRWLATLLLPLSWLFRLLITLRRYYYHRIAPSASLPVPVVAVGNINVGGAGKTPLLIALARALRQRGFRPGVVSRGYGSRAPHYPFLVSAGSPVEQAGDEPLMIARRSGCPVMIDADRLAAARALIAGNHCNVILSDDGLQHYRLPRDLEIVVVDGQRGVGNGHLLPAGPLREPLSRLQEVDWLVINGDGGAAIAGHGKPAQRMRLLPDAWQAVHGIGTAPVEQPPWSSGRVHALAGIGNPARFFQTLRDLGLDVIEHGFPDHHPFQVADLRFDDDLPVVMTEKDAVKCQAVLESAKDVPTATLENYWYLTVHAQLEEEFYDAVADAIHASRRHSV
ncbi:tetraacyldisaccharide 4'-kinase [Gilvimarinus sp. F26214L]|uniref:tetraacyldisaccharide 4'-kinase n=1 Tax=Gilvimarinus sp. DZF01 TaxID=3461371 RepID=UPI004045EB49